MTKSPLLLLAAALALGAAGCTLFRHVPVEPPPVAQAPPPAPALPKPTATHRFEIDAGTEIVGYVQKTVVGKDDTLPDIARRFDLGYEEMRLATQGVDPWCPGAGPQSAVP